MLDNRNHQASTSADDGSAEAGSADVGSVEDGLNELRKLLFAEEQQKLATLNERVENQSLRTQDVSRVLSEAVALRSSQSSELSRTLTSNVEEAIEYSIRRDPQVLADSLFPIMGPAIRNAIGAALQGMMQSLNQTLEQSVSPQSFRWRLEAMRTGKPFAEIVLLHTLLYRVEQVFLIHRETGLLLCHVAAGGTEVQDADMVSGMLSAIQDFVRDSFATSTQDALQTLNFGELTVWIEQGPQVLLAGVIRGTPPEQLRDTFRMALERIHRAQGAALEDFQGDTTPFEATQPELEACLTARYGKNVLASPKRADNPVVRKNRRIQLAIFAVLVVLALSVPLSFRIRHQRQWNDYLEALRREPGIVVVETGQRDGRYQVIGMLDPLAVKPESLLGKYSIQPNTVRFDWQPYHSLEPRFVLQRAQRMLHAPATVSFEIKDDTLYLSGSAPSSWITGARWAALFVPGVERVDATSLKVEKPVPAQPVKPQPVKPQVGGKAP